LFQRGSTIFPKGVRYGDIVTGLPIPDGSADGIYTSHVLQHLSLEDFRPALNNTYRLLRPGGIFRLVVPDLEIRSRKYLEKLDLGDPDANSWFMRASRLGAEHRNRSPAALARAVFGHTTNLWLWDERSLTAALHEVGFINIRRCKFNDTEDEAFQLVEDAGRFHDDAANFDECAMEARKPGATRAF
jgi:predicted SAM-dependent methyltransferase